MSSILRKLFRSETKKVTQKNSITGRNNSFPVPYLSKLEGNQLQPGQSLIVRGYIIGRNEFIINLTNGSKVEKEEENDTLDNRLLAIRANIALKRIYLNACIDGEWGREGSVKHKWTPGDEFDIRIRCHEKYFEIFADHKLLAKFAYYVPISNISHIYMNGDAELYTVSWEGKYYQVPYTADIPGNFYPGRKLYVSAVAKKRAKQFVVDFHSGNDVAFRFNPRIAEKKLIRNTRSEERWGTEEKDLEMQFPFKKKRGFDLLFYCEENRFLCHVDDCLVCSFTHRMSPRDIDKLSIDGDIELQGVHLK
uniref:Galectin n=1 Tax=Setaria digitata TaxID=48799 RepID=A0A915Q1Q9_9BILA